MRKYPALTRLVIGYVGFITLWLLSRFLVFDQLWPLALLNTVAEYLFIPIPLLIILIIILSLWQHQRVSLILLLLPIVGFVSLLGELFWPTLSKSTQPQEGSLITVMSFNVLHENQDYAATVSSIRAASPDLIGFEELTPTNANAIAQMLNEYPYGTLKTWKMAAALDY